ncbi:YchJ family protein [Bordetella avium]|uniref:YchJ family protein n=1 Tax=Bordetella avium TaxID=521 RepID=UPI0039FC1127
MKKSPIHTTCPCGSGADYTVCCERWQQTPAPDAAHLMRSRYSAYTRNDIDYLLRTWHPDTRPATLEANPPDLKWLGLEVRRHQQQDDNRAIVEFIARYRQAGRAVRMHEISRFEKIDGQWYYLDGEFPA